MGKYSEHVIILWSYTLRFNEATYFNWILYLVNESYQKSIYLKRNIVI